MRLPALPCLGTALLALAACHAPARHAGELALKPYAGTDLRTVDVTVAGRTTQLIFDTGAGYTVLTPDEVRLAGCLPFGQVTGFRADGGRIVMQRCGPVALDVDGGYSVEREVGVFDLSPLLPRNVPPVGGLMGLQSFDGRAVTLDLAHDRFVIETRRTLARRIRGMRPIRVRIVRGAGGDVEAFIETRATTGTLWMEVDSGNNGPVFLAPHAQQQLGIELPKGTSRQMGLDVIGLGTVPVTVAGRDMIYDGELDPAFLRQIVLTVDLGSARAWASLNAPEPGRVGVIGAK